jgi:hypothetical protein
LIFKATPLGKTTQGRSSHLEYKVSPRINCYSWGYIF